MLQIVHCDNCRKSGQFDLSITFEFVTNHCDKCYHSESTRWRFNFCTHSCMFSWLHKNEIEEKGFHCQSCINYENGESTGWLGGFESNGPCHVCNGEKRVKSVELEVLNSRIEVWQRERGIR